MAIYRTSENADSDVKSSLIITCNCISQHSLIMVNEWVDEYEYNDGIRLQNQIFDMAFFESGLNNTKHSLWERLKWCFKFLKNGTIYCDAISMDANEAKQLANYLLDRVSESKNND